MIFRVSWILIILVVESSWITSASTSPTGSTIMKTLRSLVKSKGKTCPKKLAKLCKRESNLTQVLQEAVTLAVENCHEQFRYTRWNCTLNQRLFDNVSREASVVTAIFAASLTHAFARSCVERKFRKCSKTDQSKFSWEKKQWELTAPGDDLKFGRRMARRILFGKKKQKGFKKRANLEDVVSIHNVEVGLRAVGKTQENCQCQGYFSSCNVQICRKIMVDFEEPVKILRSRYTEARMVGEGADIHRRVRREKNRFYYTAKSSNFCENTHGRECLDEMNCSILCCARGFETRKINRPRKCRCVMSGECCTIKCQTCPTVERKHICK